MTMYRACGLAELAENKPLGVEVNGTAIVLVRQGESVYALRDECSHAELALSEGDVTRSGIECWLHGSCFDLRTGAPQSLPATEPVDTFAVSIVDEDVLVGLTPINRDL